MPPTFHSEDLAFHVKWLHGFLQYFSPKSNSESGLQEEIVVMMSSAVPVYIVKNQLLYYFALKTNHFLARFSSNLVMEEMKISYGWLCYI